MKLRAMVVRVLFLVLFVLVLLMGKMTLWLAFFAVSLAEALIFGRIYCGYV